MLLLPATFPTIYRVCCELKVWWRTKLCKVHFSFWWHCWPKSRHKTDKHRWCSEGTLFLCDFFVFICSKDLHPFLCLCQVIYDSIGSGAIAYISNSYAPRIPIFVHWIVVTLRFKFWGNLLYHTYQLTFLMFILWSVKYCLWLTWEYKYSVMLSQIYCYAIIGHMKAFVFSGKGQWVLSA